MHNKVQQALKEHKERMAEYQEQRAEWDSRHDP